MKPSSLREGAVWPRSVAKLRGSPALIGFMLSALVSAGCRILFCSSANESPFVITFETPIGERLGIAAYAFRVTRKSTRNCQINERSFHIQYGNKRDDSLHWLWTDRFGLYTTLLLGIDPIEGFFVAADPAAHNPTTLPFRLEFKNEHADAIRAKGWHAWERSRRRAAEQIEVLVGGTQQRFLDLVRFERAAVGLSAGHRQLLAEKMRDGG